MLAGGPEEGFGTVGVGYLNRRTHGDFIFICANSVTSQTAMQFGSLPGHCHLSPTCDTEQKLSPRLS